MTLSHQLAKTRKMNSISLMRFKTSQQLSPLRIMILTFSIHLVILLLIVRILWLCHSNMESWLMKMIFYLHLLMVAIISKTTIYKPKIPVLIRFLQLQDKAWEILSLQISQLYHLHSILPHFNHLYQITILNKRKR